MRKGEFKCGVCSGKGCDVCKGLTAAPPAKVAGRCKARQTKTGLRCGLQKGHEGDHNLLIETGSPWAKT